jgi:FkbM family methyltransferase
MHDKNLIDYLNFVKSKGLKIDTVYDVGAWMGYWSNNLRSAALPDATFILFEANPAYATQLTNSGFRAFNTVLSNPGREYVDFYNGTNTGDSYYKETTTVYDAQTSIRLPCTTLDELIATHNLPHPNFLKVDTQGSELDVLAGAESIIKTVDLIHVECPIIRWNSGAPDIRDYLEYFRTHDFLPVKLLEEHMAEDIFTQVDIMFMRRETKERILGPTSVIRPWTP